MGDKLGSFLRVLGSGLSKQAFQANVGMYQQEKAQEADMEKINITQMFSTLGPLGVAMKNAKASGDMEAVKEISAQVKASADKYPKYANNIKNAFMAGQMGDQKGSGRGGYVTLQDVVIEGKTYKVPFDHRSGAYKWGEKQEISKEGLLLSPKDPSQEAAVTGAKKVASIEATETTTARIDLPKVRSNAKQLKSIVKKVLSHKGFKSVVGAPSVGKVGQYIPGTDAAGFKALFDQLSGKQFSQAYETLKGGGQITEIEGEKATNALSTMRTSVNEKEFKKAAKEFITEIDRLSGIAAERAKAPSASVTKTIGDKTYIKLNGKWFEQ